MLTPLSVSGWLSVLTLGIIPKPEPEPEAEIT